jgi:hypothetical protein
MLDFDGVLHPAQGSDMPEFVHAPRLVEILGSAACEIVVSSTWREHYSLRELRTLLPKQMGPQVRFRNILAWLEGQVDIVDWRALDDSPSEFPSDCPNLILCDGRHGLAAAQEEALRHWLRAYSS